MQRNKLIWIVALVVVIVAVGGYFMWSKQNTKINKQNKNQSDGVSVGSQASNSESKIASGTPASNLNDNSQDGTALSDGSSPEEKRSDEKPDENLRQQIIAYINTNLNKLVTPPANDKWDTPTYYFVGNSNVYVELYGVDTDLAGVKLLYKAEKNGDAIKLTETARYTEGEEDWNLSSGKDDFDSYVMEEYDYNEQTKKWEKTDEFTDESYTDGSSITSNDNADNTGKVVE